MLSSVRFCAVSYTHLDVYKRQENPLAVSRKNVSIAVSSGGTVTANGIPVADGTTLSVPTGKNLNFSIQSDIGYLLQNVSFGEIPVPGITDAFLTDEVTADTSIVFSFARDASQPVVYLSLIHI